MNLVIPFLSLLFFASALGSSFDQPIKEKMFKDLEIIRSAFEVKYAPAAWKEEQFEWSLNEEVKKAKRTEIDIPAFINGRGETNGSRSNSVLQIVLPVSRF